MAKSSFALKGVLKGRDTGIIILWYPNIEGKYFQDTAHLTNGRFQFKGYLKEPSYVHLIGSKKDGNYASFYLECGHQEIFLEENNFDNFRMTGSFTQKQEDTLRTTVKKIYLNYKTWIDEGDDILDRYKKESDSAAKKNLGDKLSEIGKRNREIYEKERRVTIRFISAHPDSYVSPSHLYTFLTNRTLTTDSSEKLFGCFTERVKKSIPGKLIQDELNKRQLNIKADDFSAKDVTNAYISLSAFKGKCVLLDFWASWCVPCLEQLPELKELQSKYSSKGFEIIAISIDSNKEKWEASIKKNGIQNFHHVLANDDIKAKYSNTTQPIPSQILINRDGIIIWNSMRSSTDIKTILKKEFEE